MENNLHIWAGLAAAALLITWGAWTYICEEVEAVWFRLYLARIRRLWRLEVKDEDIIAATGDGCWWEAFKQGRTPREAIYAGYARA